MCELGPDVVVERGERLRVEAAEVLVERVHEDRERQVVLELGGRSARARAGRGRPRGRASSASRRVLPIPGSPASTSAAGSPASTASRSASRAPISALRPMKWLVLGATTQHRSGSPKREIRVRDQGGRPDVARGASSASSTHDPLPAPPQPRAARVRRRVRLVQGAPEPASPPAHLRLVPLRRPRDLVDGRSRLEEEALALLPFFVAERTTATRVSEVEIP